MQIMIRAKLYSYTFAPKNPLCSNLVIRQGAVTGRTCSASVPAQDHAFYPDVAPDIVTVPFPASPAASTPVHDHAPSG